MICLKTVKKYCKDDISKIENYEQAINDKNETWHCHHKDEIKILPSGITIIRDIEYLKENNRYYNCPSNELIFLSRKEHLKIHNVCKRLYKATTTKPRKGFGLKFYEHYGICRKDNEKLYHKEKHYFYRNKKCSWEL